VRLATFAINGVSRIGIVADDDPNLLIDVSSAEGIPSDLMAVAAGGDSVRRSLDRLRASALDAPGRTVRVNDVRLRPPLSRPGKLLCLAGNYRKHIAESGYEVPVEADIITPQFFLKPSTTLIGPGDDVPISHENVSVGWEVELAVVIGRQGRGILASAAMQHVFGYMVLNDISERGLHSLIPGRRVRENDRFFDWLAGKWFDGFAPCGPWIVTADEIADPHALGIRLRVNGDLRQEGSTGEMIFRIPELLEWASSIMTLEPGDIISTGTPVGAGIGGAAVLAEGDEITCEIERVGRLVNRVRRRA
jgi:2-keto-4-pentenoate hydratase/2-oxohepta-3-ene-1,7-dioic acid hydratase in catechol pathway